MTDDEIREMIEELKEYYALAKRLTGSFGGRSQQAEKVQGITAMATTASALVALENELRR